MKKYLILLLTALSVSFTSCDNETEPGGTAVEKMAGDWWVTATIMQNGNEAGDSGAGHFRMYTYNTAANVPTEIRKVKSWKAQQLPPAECRQTASFT